MTWRRVSGIRRNVARHQSRWYHQQRLSMSFWRLIRCSLLVLQMRWFLKHRRRILAQLLNDAMTTRRQRPPSGSRLWLKKQRRYLGICGGKPQKAFGRVCFHVAALASQVRKLRPQTRQQSTFQVASLRARQLLFGSCRLPGQISLSSMNLPRAPQVAPQRVWAWRSRREMRWTQRAAPTPSLCTRSGSSVAALRRRAGKFPRV
mmetsp:Transcript_114287/g.255088  ORF Transcript_114287/g.255088 Transcript_114287/m.255088 type:complete len:204 (+) Transcript_114287:525-1136(+)